MSFDPEKFAKYLQDNALRGFGQGKCAKYVRRALQAAGARVPQPYEGSGKDYGPVLLRLGFHQITVEKPETFSFMKGDVMVMQPHEGGGPTGTSRDSMDKNGFRITSRQTSGQAQDTEEGGRAMLSIVTERLVAVVSLALFCCVAQAREGAPRVLQEPVLGLRLPAAKLQLTPLPDEIRNKCAVLADNEKWKGRLWVYATTKDAAGTYYVVGGYYERPNPEPGQPRYQLDTAGAVFQISGQTCSAYGGAKEVFDARYFEETPQPILQKLAVDLASQLSRTLGGADRLRTELQNQRIDFEQLSPELKEAFKTYFESKR